MPKLTPLRAIATTIELSGTFAAASSIALHAAIDRLRKKWSLPAMNASARAAASRGTGDSNIAGARRLNRSAVAAALRLWTSSPMLSACAINGINSMPPVCSSVARNTGARSPAIQRRRSITSGPLAPKRSTLPSPSLQLLYARLPCVRFSTTQSGIDGLMIPAIGPTAPW